MKSKYKEKIRIKRRDSGKLKKLDYFMLGFGSMVGVGWAVSSNHWLAQAGGPWMAFIGFIIGTVLLIPISLAYGELMSKIPVSGGVMSYTYAAFGSFISFLSSWFVVLAYMTILPWEAIYINQILSGIFPILRSGTVLYYFMDIPIYLNSALLGVAFAIGLFIINLRGSKSAAKLQKILSWSIIIIAFLVIILSLIKGSMSNLHPLYKNVGVGSHTNPFSGILTMIVLVPFFMSGFDTIPQSVGEARKSLKFSEISKILVVSILAAGGFYSLIIISTGSLIPWEEYSKMASPAMGLVLESQYGGIFGKIIGYLVLVGTISGLFTTWNGMFMASARLVQSMGESGLLPKTLGKVNHKYNTPVVALILCFIAAAIGPFLGINFIDSLTNLGSVAFVVGWFLTSLAAFKLRKSEIWPEARFTAPGGSITLALAVIIAGTILIATFIPGLPTYMGKSGVKLFIAWLLLGMVFYYFANYKDRGMAESERSKIILGIDLSERKYKE